MPPFRLLIYLTLCFLYALWFTATHDLHCTPIDNKEVEHHWKVSHVYPQKTIMPALLCSLFGENHRLIGLRPESESAPYYEYDPHGHQLLIDYHNTSRIRLLRFTLECNFIHYKQECYIEVHDVKIKERTEKSSLFHWLSLLINILWLPFYILFFVTLCLCIQKIKI